MFKIFVRWNADGDGHHRVEVTRDDSVVQKQSFANNEDRLYGYCQGVVATMKTIGIPIEMPRCLTGRHVCADHSRED